MDVKIINAGKNVLVRWGLQKNNMGQKKSQILGPNIVSPTRMYIEKNIYIERVCTQKC